MKKLLCCILSLLAVKMYGQELYVFSEPASNLPANSISVKITDHFVISDNIYNRFSHRLMPQVQFGISKKFMFNIGGTFGNMHTPDFRYESVRFYAKYRFLSKDDIHKHFRMAAFLDASATKAPFHYDEITLMGDKSGIEAGIIATQLWNKFALSGAISHTQVLDKSRNDKVIYVPTRLYQSINYSLSGGYLLFPKEYTDYKQTNLNLYAELLGEQSLDSKKYCLDLAPAIQLIFNSNTKLNLGYRFQVSGNMNRMTNNSWQVSFERTFLNALKKRK
ncbi:MAG: hypothetical protein KA330_08035 [Chitinophagaceae bacterium]|nr:hypothetical protein [Chitinophagaceae bacterium]MBP6416394.1 hypothetical protein [Chitinophagaceae bacterium]